MTQKSDQYKNREHGGVKHYLLESYLERLFMIIGQHERRICYVDCFAGPWQESDNSLSGTSITLSLDVMHKCRDSLSKMENPLSSGPYTPRKGCVLTGSSIAI